MLSKTPWLHCGGGIGGRPERSVREVFIHSFIHRMFIYYYVYFSGTVLGPGETAGHKKDKVPDLREL